LSDLQFRTINNLNVKVCPLPNLFARFYFSILYLFVMSDFLIFHQIKFG